MWDCVNGGGFGFADRRRKFIRFQSQITQLFSTTEMNSSHVILQREYFQLEIKQNGNLQGIFFLLYQYSILPLSVGLYFRLILPLRYNFLDSRL